MKPCISVDALFVGTCWLVYPGLLGRYHPPLCVADVVVVGVGVGMDVR